MNARDEHAVVHEVERHPQFHSANEHHITHAGFTWCMEFFTWLDGPRWHPPTDSVEGRFEKTDDPATCLLCIGEARFPLTEHARITGRRGAR